LLKTPERRLSLDDMTFYVVPKESMLKSNYAMVQMTVNWVMHSFYDRNVWK
jgi:hypothetical protein